MKKLLLVLTLLAASFATAQDPPGDLIDVGGHDLHLYCIGEVGTPIQTVMAVAILFTLPAVVFYLFAQKYVVSGMTAGAVKG